jgi:hypothetical protein
MAQSMVLKFKSMQLGKILAVTIYSLSFWHVEGNKLYGSKGKNSFCTLGLLVSYLLIGVAIFCQISCKKAKDVAQKDGVEHNKSDLISKSRDLTKYKQSSSFDTGRINDSEERIVQEKLRAFLWENWFQNQLASISVRYHTKEGDVIKHSYFVEPDKQNVWQISIEIDSNRVDLGNVGSTSSFKESQELHAYFVERYEKAVKVSKKASLPIEKEAVMTPDKYLIVLKDKNSKEIFEI